MAITFRNTEPYREHKSLTVSVYVFRDKSLNGSICTESALRKTGFSHQVNIRVMNKSLVSAVQGILV